MTQGYATKLPCQLPHPTCLGSTLHEPYARRVYPDRGYEGKGYVRSVSRTSSNALLLTQTMIRRVEQNERG